MARSKSQMVSRFLPGSFFFSTFKIKGEENPLILETNIFQSPQPVLIYSRAERIIGGNEEGEHGGQESFPTGGSESAPMGLPELPALPLRRRR